MGCRAQVEVKFENAPSVFLYSHWGGETIKEVVASALARGKSRWTDSEYLARIIFNQMTKGREFEELGFGIGTSEHGDLNVPLVAVDCSRQEVDDIPFTEFIAKHLRES